MENKIHNQDCIIGMKGLRPLTADIVVCDPPYNIGKEFGNNRTLLDTKEYIKWCKKWIRECLRVLKDSGTMYIFGFSETLAYIRTTLQCNVRWLIWHYTNKTCPSLNFWQRSHESILVCWKQNKTFNLELVREPYTQSYTKNCAGKVRKSTKGRFGSKETVYNANPRGALPRDVIKVPALAGGAGRKERVDHPTQKPISLIKKLLDAAKVTGGLVVVPFAGSGTECLVAKDVGMNFVGFEVNMDYIRIAEGRLKSSGHNVKNA